jgi:hypothetical protein
MGSRRPVLIIIIIGLAVAMPWVLAGCATTTSAPPQDVSWLVGQWQGQLSASGLLARIGVTSGPVTMVLRQEGSGFVSGEITGMGGRPCTLRGRGDDKGSAGSAAVYGLTAGQNHPSVPFEFTRQGPNKLEGTLENSKFSFHRE